MDAILEELLKPVSADLPCGLPVDSDPQLFSEFHALEQAVRGKPEIVTGDSRIPAVDPAWGEAAKLARQLLVKTKDLRVAIYLTQAQMMTAGWPGLATGVNTILSLLQVYWEGVHPRLIDEDGDFDPDYRVNTVAELASDKFLRELRTIPIVASRAVGKFSYRDHCIAQGLITPTKGQPTPLPAQVDAAFMDVDHQTLQATSAAVKQVAAQLKEILALFERELGPENTPNLNPLNKDIAAITHVLEQYLAQRGLAGTAADGSVPVASETGGAERSPAMNRPANAEIKSREDVIHQIDRICRYYQQYEPSSPVPLVLNRAKKMVTMDFMAIMRDLSPESVASITKLAGLTEVKG